MRFKDKDQFINYTQLIPMTFLIIWILSFAYVLYSAPYSPDEINGKIYGISSKGKTIYISLIEGVLVGGSIIAFFVSILVLQLTASHYWRDETDKK